MARYDYRCTSCGNVFEVEHGMTERPEVTCPSCGGAAEDIAAHEIPIGTFQSYPHQGGFDGHFCARFVRI